MSTTSQGAMRSFASVLFTLGSPSVSVGVYLPLSLGQLVPMDSIPGCSLSNCKFESSLAQHQAQSSFFDFTLFSLSRLSTVPFVLGRLAARFFLFSLHPHTFCARAQLMLFPLASPILGLVSRLRRACCNHNKHRRQRWRQGQASNCSAVFIVGH